VMIFRPGISINKSHPVPRAIIIISYFYADKSLMFTYQLNLRNLMPKQN
jgi:hypothetical protein